MLRVPNVAPHFAHVNELAGLGAFELRASALESDSLFCPRSLDSSWGSCRLPLDIRCLFVSGCIDRSSSSASFSIFSTNSSGPSSSANGSRHGRCGGVVGAGAGPLAGDGGGVGTVRPPGVRGWSASPRAGGSISPPPWRGTAGSAAPPVALSSARLIRSRPLGVSMSFSYILARQAAV